MTIKNVGRSNNAVLSIAGGAVSTLTSDPGDTPPSGAAGVRYHSACNKAGAWFEGRLYTFRYLFSSGTTYNMQLYRWASSTDLWGAVPSGGVLTDTNHQERGAVPGLIAFKNNIFLFWDQTGDSGTSTSVARTWSYLHWDPTTGGSGTTSVRSGSPYVYTQTFTKTSSTRDPGHILDVVEHQGNFYLATPYNILTMTPPDGTLISLDENTNADQMVARALGKFQTGSGVTQLYALDANGLVKSVSATIVSVANLALINATITNGNPASPISLGYGPALVQVGTKLYAFLNDSTGTVLFESSNGTSWTEVSNSKLPVAWRNTHSHIKATIDPSVPEVRIMFVNASSGAFDIYSFDGTTFTYYGTGSPSYVMSFTYFDQTAGDVEIESSVTVNASAGTASIPYRIYRETGGTADVTAEYSLDGGSNWFTALAKTGSGTGSEVLTGLSAADTRPIAPPTTYTFVWDWLTQIGSTLRPNVRFRIRTI